MRPSGAMGTSTRVTPYELFILGLSVWTIISLAFQSTFALEPETLRVFDVADYALCGVFFLDFVHSVRVAPDRWRYMRTWGWIDLVSSVPAIDVLRIGRAARL